VRRSVRQSIHRGAGNDACSSGDEKNAASRPDLITRTDERRRQRGGVRSLVVGDDDLGLGERQTICKAVRTPQDPFEISNENVPWACLCASFGIGADVLLNHRRERWFGQAAVTVDARVYQEIDIVSLRPASWRQRLAAFTAKRNAL